MKNFEKRRRKEKRSKLTYILPIFVLLLIGIGCLGLSKSCSNINKESDKIEEMATGYMSEEIEKLKMKMMRI